MSDKVSLLLSAATLSLVLGASPALAQDAAPVADAQQGAPASADQAPQGADIVVTREVVDDPWRHLEDSDPLPESGPITVSWARWTAERDTIKRAPAELGVRIPNTVPTAEIGAEAGRFGLIAVSFPNFGDGRAFSQARVLRDRYDFRGELRATGYVLRDQLLFLQRCGIDAFELPEKALAENWLAAFDEYDVFYQPAEDNRPWIARQRLGRN